MFFDFINFPFRRLKISHLTIKSKKLNLGAACQHVPRRRQRAGPGPADPRREHGGRRRRDRRRGGRPGHRSGMQVGT